jgi:hypothetical protein
LGLFCKLRSSDNGVDLQSDRRRLGQGIVVMAVALPDYFLERQSRKIAAGERRPAQSLRWQVSSECPGTSFAASV